MERHPELYDGGVDWQGLIWLPEGPNLLTFLPPAVKYFPEYRDLKSRAARDAIIRAGFAPESDFLWQYHYEVYWNSTLRSYREEFDPYWPGSDAEYDYAERLDPQKNPLGQLIKSAVEKVSLTGNIGKRLITLHGTLDALLPVKMNSDKYAELVKKAGRSDLHSYYKVEGGNHVDGLYDYAGSDPRNPDQELREKFFIPRKRGVIFISRLVVFPEFSPAVFLASLLVTLSRTFRRGQFADAYRSVVPRPGRKP